MTARREVPVIFLGLGNVGRTLLRQILDTCDVTARRTGLQLIPIALADTSGVLLDAEGLPEESLHAALQAKGTGRSLGTLSESQPPGHLEDALRSGVILVDVTASTETGSLLRNALGADCGVALANKHPLSGLWAEAQSLFDYPLMRCEATVGAGLPVVATLRYLLDTGDRVTGVEGCLSGTLGYLCAQLECGVSYSNAISQARSLGYTEPDPREDLSGRDVARKALILARTAGWPLEMADLSVESLYSESLVDVSAEEFMASASMLDGEYSARVEEAQVGGRTLRYAARVGPDGGDVGLIAVPRNGPLGALKGPANYVALYTVRYDEEPLVLSGPGAGPEVTAAGVLGDVISLARQMA